MHRHAIISVALSAFAFACGDIDDPPLAFEEDPTIAAEAAAIAADGPWGDPHENIGLDAEDAPDGVAGSGFDVPEPGRHAMGTIRRMLCDTARKNVAKKNAEACAACGVGSAGAGVDFNAEDLGWHADGGGADDLCIEALGLLYDVVEACFDVCRSASQCNPPAC